MRDIIRSNAAVIGIALVCLIMFAISLVVVGIVVVWLFAFGGIQMIGNACLTLAIPLAIIVVVAILAKKYLFGGKK